MASLAERATPRLIMMGCGPARPYPSGKYIPIRWPTGLWFRQHTQNDDLHIFVYQDRIALRVHVDAFHGDRSRNNEAIDLIRSAIERDLLARLPDHREISWRAAKGGSNQVCAVVGGGGVGRDDVAGDADWVCAATHAWLEGLGRHPIPDLRSRVAERPAS